MRQIIFLFLLFTILLFPQSQVLAKDVPVCSTESLDPNPIGIPANLTRDASGTITGANCPDSALCTKLLTAPTTYRCYKSDTGVVTAPVTPACTTNCTSAKGLRCDTQSNGSIKADGDGIMTAIGCIPTEPKALVNGLLKYLTVASGGIALLLMILAALSMITAEGNPDTIKKAQERFYSAIIGLLLIIFAVLLMQVIGVDILGLPGFVK